MDVLQWLEALSAGQSAVLVAVGAGLLGLIVAFCLSGRGSSGERQKEEETRTAEVENVSSAEEGDEKKTEPQKKQWKVKNTGKPKKTVLPSHPLLAADFKGHTGAVLSLDFDSTGKYLVSCSEDRTIRLWYMKTLEEKEHKYSRKNVELDHATHIKFSPDGTAVLTFLSVANALQVFKIAKQKGSLTVSEPTIDFPKVDSSPVISMGIASTGKFVMTCTSTAFTIWTLRGEVLATVETKQTPNSCAIVSPCGKFIACSGFTPDVKIWEVEFSKGGDFHQVSRAMELKGHSAAVVSLSFNGDSQRMATASKDGTWKFWNTDVRYRLSEDPKLLTTGEIPETGSTAVAVAPDSRVVAISVDTSLFIFSSSSGDMMEKLVDVHGDVVSCLCWDPTSQYLVSAGDSDRHIRVWHNHSGRRVHLSEMKAELPKANSDAMKGLPSESGLMLGGKSLISSDIHFRSIADVF
jgi:WD40 repeat protein